MDYIPLTMCKPYITLKTNNNISYSLLSKAEYTVVHHHLVLKWAELLCVCLLFSPVIQAQQNERLRPREARSLGQQIWSGRPTAFKICPDSDSGQPSQAYALCASAQCFTIDNVAYCKCLQEDGRSISLPFNFSNNTPPAPGPVAGDVCDLMEVSGQGSFLVSTFSAPPQISKSYEGPEALAIYTCPGSGNLSAQCDGGLCFTATAGTDWPFLGSIGKDEVVCSCPIAAAPQIGFQFIGPADCDRDFFEQFCGVQGSGASGTGVSTGTRLAVGAVTGSGTILTKLLDGSIPPTNRCFSPAGSDDHQ